jgi:hypothetical protein
MEDFSDDLSVNVTRSTIGFADDVKVEVIGSGTVCKANKRGGILTCTHVVDELRNRQSIGLVAFPLREEQLHKILLPPECIKATIDLGPRACDYDGPDMAFIPLPETLFGSLAAFTRPVDLNEQRERGYTPEPETPVANALAGVVGEMTGAPVVFNQKATLQIGGLLYVGTIINKTVKDGYDYCDFEPIPGAGFVMPTSYGGTSGAGLWRLYFKKTETAHIHLSSADY